MKKIIATFAIAALAAVAVPSTSQADTRPVPTIPTHSTTWVRGSVYVCGPREVRHLRLTSRAPSAVRRAYVIKHCTLWHPAPFPVTVRHIEIKYPTPR